MKKCGVSGLRGNFFRFLLVWVGVNLVGRYLPRAGESMTSGDWLLTFLACFCLGVGLDLLGWGERV